MADKRLLSEYPMKRLHPVDGMAVTAQVWDEAHAYHRLRQRTHEQLRHQPGILTGLEVIASDPPDSSVYILPGAAVDASGEMIVISEPVAYDFGAAQGRLALRLTYSESRPQQDKEGGVFYIHAQFGAETGDAQPEGSGIELARIFRGRRSAICDAGVAEAPTVNEIDLRYRLEVGNQRTPCVEPASIAVCYAGGNPQAEGAHGAANLVRVLNRSARQVCLDERVPIESGLERYTLVILVGYGDFKLSRPEMNALYAVLQAGGTLLLEACRKEATPEGALKADKVFTDLVDSFGLRIANLNVGHPLLSEPNLFAIPPMGFESEGQTALQAGEGVLISSMDYGCLWQGLRRGGPASREEIRSALEWGENLLAYALKRRQEAVKK
jgi:hypothetical protein